MQPDSKNINPLFIQPFRCLCHLCRLSKKSFVRFNMMRDKGFFKLDWHWVAHALTNQSSSLGQQGLKLSLTSNNYLWVTHCIMTCGWNSTMGLIAKAIKDALEAMGFSELCDCQRKTIKAYLLQRVVFVSAPTGRGAGKSLTFELAPYAFNHLFGKDCYAIMLVIVLMISLMKEQVSILNSHGIRALYMGDDCSEEQLENILNQKEKLVFGSPEAILNDYQHIF